MFQRGDEAEGSRLKWGPAAHDEHGLYPAHEPHPGEHPSYVPVNFSTGSTSTQPTTYTLNEIMLNPRPRHSQHNHRPYRHHHPYHHHLHSLLSGWLSSTAALVIAVLTRS